MKKTVLDQKWGVGHDKKRYINRSKAHTKRLVNAKNQWCRFQTFSTVKLGDRGLPADIAAKKDVKMPKSAKGKTEQRKGRKCVRDSKVSHSSEETMENKSEMMETNEAKHGQNTGKNVNYGIVQD